MDQVAQSLGGALGVDAAQGGLIGQMGHRRPAAGTDGRHLPRLRLRSVGGHADHLGDDLPCLPHLDGIPDAQTQLPDKVLVVQRRPGHGGARQGDRLKGSRRGQHAGAAHRHLDVQQFGLLDLGGILECDSPPREFGGGAQLGPLGQAVHLDHRAVHVEPQGCTLCADLLDLRNGVLDVVHQVIPGRHRQPQLFQIVQAGGMAGQFHPPHLLHIKNEDAQTAAACHLGVFLAQAAGGGVAGIFEGGRPLQLLFLA